MEKTYKMIKEKLDSNICDLLKKPNMNLEDLKFLGESIDVLKDISIIEGMEDYSEEMERGYSETSRDSRKMTAKNRSMTAAYESGYIDGMSRARGRSSVTGRYVSRDMHHIDHRDWVDGVSGHSINDRMIANIEPMYDMAETEHERSEINDVINYIRRKGM